MLALHPQPPCTVCQQPCALVEGQLVCANSACAWFQPSCWPRVEVQAGARCTLCQGALTWTTHPPVQPLCLNLTCAWGGQAFAEIRDQAGQRPRQCFFCGQECARPSHLAIHWRTHTREKPFGCSYCEEFFSTQRDCRQHERIHTREKPFRCNHCGQHFAQRSTLDNHERIHTGARPFACTHCGRCFTRGGTLKDHLRCIHKV